jgi:hypothetical protein
MSILDRGLGIKLLTLRDLLGDEPTEAALDGATVQPAPFRARVHRFEDTGRIKDTIVAGISSVKYWIILDFGEVPEMRQKPRWMITDYRPEMRKDRYVPIGVGVDEEICNVEEAENGKALPGIYNSWDEACEVSSDLCAICHVHED